MRLRNVAGSREAIAASPYVVEASGTPSEAGEEACFGCAGRWREIFGNGNPLCVEIGMGKGKFIHTMAKGHTSVNYVGVEKYSSVLVRALAKMEQEELGNLRFLRMDAEDIGRAFGAGEVDRIYLNFSDPWPKERHAGRRLPSRAFLARYARILKPGGRLEFKTDNRALFEFALGELAPAGWEAETVSYNLHRDGALMRDNVMTEYEEKFSSQGKPIYRYVIHPAPVG